MMLFRFKPSAEGVVRRDHPVNVDLGGCVPSPADRTQSQSYSNALHEFRANGSL